MFRYVGNGFIPGIPARDLTDEEVSRYGSKRLLDSGLYEKPKKEKSITKIVIEENQEGE